MKLPTWMTTVTPLSKVVALVLFISFVVLSFYLGLLYSENVLTNTPINVVTKDSTSDAEIAEENSDENIATEAEDSEEPGTVINNIVVSDDWIEVNNKYGYSFRYPSELKELQQGEIANLSMNDLEDIGLKDESDSYWIDDKLYELTTYMYIESMEKEDLSISELANSLLDIYKDNEITYVKTVQEPTNTTFRNRQAYTFSVINAGINYLDADGTTGGGILGADEVIKIYLVEDGDRLLVISYYDTAIYRMVIETFEFD